MFQGKVTEAQLLDLLGQFGEQVANAATTITIAKHHNFDDDEIDLDNLDL